MTFDEFSASLENLAGVISNDRFVPDIIVGIARGGWIPARLLSKHLGVKKLFSYGTGYADAARTKLVTYQSVDLPADVARVLVVEDFLESGKSIKHVVEELSSPGIDVRSACVGYLDKTILLPNYSLGRVAEIPKLPWE